MIALTSQIETPYHRLPAGAKLGLLCLLTLVLFMIDGLWVRLWAVVFVIALYLAAGTGFARQGWRHLKPVFHVVSVIAIWHVVTGTMTEGVRIVLLLIAAVGLANLVTMTTRLDDMIGVVRVLAAPLRHLGLRTGVLEIAIAMVIRFTPVLAHKGALLAESWRSRSPRRPGWRIVVPLVLLAIDDAEHVSDALKARGGIR